MASAAERATGTLATLPAPARLWGQGLPREVVAAEQRRRILAAVPTAVAGRGFDHTFVEHIIAVATISRPTFYEQFDNRSDVFDVACEQGFDRLQAQIEAAYESRGAWQQKVAAAIAAALEFANAEPLTANLLLVETVASGATMSGRYYDCLDRLARGLRRGRALRPEADPLPHLTEQSLLGALVAIVARHLHAGEQAALPELAPQLTEFVLTPYIGAVQARRIGRSQGCAAVAAHPSSV